MAALKFSLIALFTLSSCAIAQNPIKVSINNSAQGCFALEVSSFDLAEPSTFTVSVNSNASGDCPCKSSLLKYLVVQQLEDHENFLISGVFSPLGVAELILPLSAQTRLVVEDKPILVSVTCASN